MEIIPYNKIFYYRMRLLYLAKLTRTNVHM